MALTPAVREFLLRLSELLGVKASAVLVDGDVAVTIANDIAFARLGDVELEVDDRRVVVRYSPEQIVFTSRDEALRFIEMIGDGRVELEVARGLLWATICSYRDGQSIPFRRTRMPWMTLHPRTERRTIRITAP